MTGCKRYNNKRTIIYGRRFGGIYVFLWSLFVLESSDSRVGESHPTDLIFLPPAGGSKEEREKGLKEKASR